MSETHFCGSEPDGTCMENYAQATLNLIKYSLFMQPEFQLICFSVSIS